MATRTISVRVFRGIEGSIHRGRRHIPKVRVQTRLLAAAPSLETVSTESKDAVGYQLLCPICLKTEFTVDQSTTEPPALNCKRCRRSFDSNSTFVDLTLASGAPDTAYTLSNGTGMTTFQNPLVGFVYERGWRQNFRAAGFPGPDREFEMAMEFLQPVTGGTVMDLSCGSGLFTRRFLSCGAFTSIVAVDYSVAMLTQTQQFVNRMDSNAAASLQLVRADVGRLPFQTESFNAIFSGAALHCWPNVSMALAEISRLLRPGGVFVFSTFTRVPKEIDDLINRSPLRPFRPLIPGNRPGSSVSHIYHTRQLTFYLSQINYWDEQPLKDVCKLAGLENFEAIRNRQFIMVRVNKPHA